MTSYNQLEQFP